LKILLEYGADPNIYNNNRETPLMWASFLGYYNSVSLLLKYKANPNITDDDGETPLMCASRAEYNNSANIVRILLEYGANPFYCKRGPRLFGCSALGIL
jgi:ankyrin repeat protein